MRLSHDRTVAWRTSGFANGITFSDRPLLPNEIFLIEIDKNENGWSGHIRLGLTQIDPNDRSPLPQYALPDLNQSGSAWVFAITKNKTRVYDGINGEYSLPSPSKPIYSTFSHLPLFPFQPSMLVQLPTDVGSRLGVFYRITEGGLGEMHLVMNGEDKGPVVVDLPLHTGKMYAVVDIYGTTKQVRIIPVYSKGTCIMSISISSLFLCFLF